MAGMIPRKTGLASIASVILLSAGCGPSVGEVSGKVLYNGAPLPSGQVLFFGAPANQVNSAQIDKDGNYRIQKVVVGPVRIAVTTPDPGMMKKPHPLGPNPTDKEKFMFERETRGYVPVVPIPSLYNDADKSGLTYTVVPGPQTHNIELKGP